MVRKTSNNTVQWNQIGEVASWGNHGHSVLRAVSKRHDLVRLNSERRRYRNVVSIQQFEQHQEYDLMKPIGEMTSRGDHENSMVRTPSKPRELVKLLQRDDALERS